MRRFSSRFVSAQVRLHAEASAGDESGRTVGILTIVADHQTVDAAAATTPSAHAQKGPTGRPPHPRRGQADPATQAGQEGRLRSWRPFTSARGRILGWSVLLLAAALAVFTIVTRDSQVSSMNAQVTSDLAHEIAEFNTLAARNGAVSGTEPKEGSGPAATPHPAALRHLLQARTGAMVVERNTVLLGIINGKIATTSRNFRAALRPPDSVLAHWAALRSPVSGTLMTAAGPARYRAVPVQIRGTPGRGVFVAAVLTGPQQASINNLTRLQVEVGGIALLVGSLLAWLVAGRVLRPVRATTELARRITETDLSERIPGRGRDEVSALALTFNRMLDRLEAAMTTQRRFVADAGHELRTPITIIQGNLDTLTAGNEEDAETLAILADEISRMNRLVDELLLLAASERPDFLRPESTDLARLTRSLLAKAQTLDDRPWTLTGAADGTAVLDPQRITQAVMQLAANAAAHTPRGSPVEISSAVSDAQVMFTVSDHGPGIPAAAREQIFARFARLDSRRTDGTGLGLAIVAAIAAAHNGNVQVEERCDASPGAVFCLAIPHVSGAAAESTSTTGIQLHPGADTRLGGSS
jgi:two-component system, OmpR family, sensor kinase